MPSAEDYFFEVLPKAINPEKLLEKLKNYGLDTSIPRLIPPPSYGHAFWILRLNVLVVFFGWSKDPKCPSRIRVQSSKH